MCRIQNLLVFEAGEGFFQHRDFMFYFQHQKRAVVHHMSHVHRGGVFGVLWPRFLPFREQYPLLAG